MKMMSTFVSIKLVGAIFIVSQFLILLSNYTGAVAAAKNVSSVSGGCKENERHALLELKASMVLDNTSLLPTWDSKSDGCCAWEGIVCSNQTGHVEMLDLNGDQFGPFRGKINASLMELRHLKYLNLSLNMFSKSNIPELFGSLSNLRFLDLRSSLYRGRFPNDPAHLWHLQYLDLSWNYLEGTIPHQLGNLSHLQHLDLGFNSFVGTIPHSIGNLSHLQHLDLSSTYALAGKIPHQLGNLSHLQYLDLSSNDLEGTIPHQLGNLSHLQHLDLSSNFGLAGTIPDQLGNLSHLQYLGLRSNLLAGTIPHQLGSLSNLQELHLGWNEGLKVHDKDNQVGSEWLSNLTLLTHLDLSRVQNLNSSHVWLQMIGKLKKLEELKLSRCELSLSHSILNLSNSLRILDLSSNNLHVGTLESFRDMCTLHSLRLANSNLNEDISTILLKLSGCARNSSQDLSLYGNQIIGTFPDLSIFPSLIEIDLSKNLLSWKVLDGDKFLPSKLETLIVQFNSLEGGIPKSFANLCSLRSLDLSSNKLSEYLSVILENLSAGCAKYSLQDLNLGSNQIIGTLPDMSRFSSLRYLLLSDNRLHGRILKNSTFPYQLESLYLDSNKLEGVITDSHFGNMSMLMQLNLSSNSLTLKFSENWVPPFQLYTLYLRSCTLGPSFPKWLRSQKYLELVDISNDGIEDVVPAWFWNQTRYKMFMNISYNTLKGTIPNLSIRFSEYSQVILDSNQFEGSIPTFFRSAILLQMSKNRFSETDLLLCTNTTVNRLRILDLSMNRLSSQLPDCWSHLKALEFIDLSDNTLSGEVPSSIGSLLELKVLILRNNSLTGKLPFSLKNCTNLVMLDLGDNRFSGPIPYWLGQQLQMLSLRRNQFNGTLPQSLCDITNIQLLDLSENNLTGQIFKCLTKFSAMSQSIFPNRTTNSDLFYPIGHGARLGYEGYDLVALLMWKGSERLFKNNELVLRSIDLSSNQLTGDLPEEIGNLVKLVSLNLSSNNLTGEITSKIGRLTSLEFLDLSRNHFYGVIPPSLAQIDRLSMLNLSDNNLSGRIPIGTQLQSFEASSYEGNVDLCGKPLEEKCPGDEEVANQNPETHEESSREDKKPIYLSVTLGFITGFWGHWGSLLLGRNWRHKYVLFLNNIIDTMYFFLVLNATKFQRWLKGLLEKFV